MLAKQHETKGYLLDNYPRSLEQAQAFEATVAPCGLVLHLEALDYIIFSRLLQRGEPWDTEPAIWRSWELYNKVIVPLVEKYKGQSTEVSCQSHIYD